MGTLLFVAVDIGFYCTVLIFDRFLSFLQQFNIIVLLNKMSQVKMNMAIHKPILSKTKLTYKKE